MFEYRVVPFRAVAKSQDAKGSQQVADQIQQLIQENVNAGWEFVSIVQVQMQVLPGCLAALGGGRANVVPLDQVIFRRAR